MREPLGKVLRIVGAVNHTMTARRIDLVAAGVAFYGLFSIFPSLAALVSVTGYFANPAIIEAAFDDYGELLPPETLPLIGGQLDRLMAANDSTLGIASLVSLLVALWSARLGVGGLARGLSAIYGLPPRGGLWNYLHALALTLAMIAVGICALVLLVVMPLILAFFPPGGISLALAEGLRWLVALVVVVVGLATFYRFGPNRAAVPGAAAVLWPGLAIALVLWAGASLGLNIYLARFAALNEVYGSIGAAMALMLWFYVGAYAVLLGGVINAVFEGRAALPDTRRGA